MTTKEFTKDLHRSSSYVSYLVVSRERGWREGERGGGRGGGRRERGGREERRERERERGEGERKERERGEGERRERKTERGTILSPLLPLTILSTVGSPQVDSSP